MNIGIIDVDLIAKQEHNFPNLACMKISGYHKEQGHKVSLIHYDEINAETLFNQKFDKVYISKVFTDSYIPEKILHLPFVEYGGTGFYFDKSPVLPYFIEHHFPDYHLYDKWINEKKGKKRSYFKYYKDFSIGFTTRGCFRHCEFCVNQNSNRVNSHSHIDEFYDPKRKYICLLDDNIFGFGDWQKIIESLKEKNKPFQFKQGLDVRLLTEKKAVLLNSCKYYGRVTFAFDSIKDKEKIETKLQLWNKHSRYSNPYAIVYCFTGFDPDENYTPEFWLQDLKDLLERINILMRYKCRPYVMRYIRHSESPFSDLLSHLMAYCNGVIGFKSMNLRDFICDYRNDKKTFINFNKKHPEIVERYFYTVFGEKEIKNNDL